MSFSRSMKKSGSIIIPRCVNGLCGRCSTTTKSASLFRTSSIDNANANPFSSSSAEYLSEMSPITFLLSSLQTGDLLIPGAISPDFSWSRGTLPAFNVVRVIISPVAPRPSPPQVHFFGNQSRKYPCGFTRAKRNRFGNLSVSFQEHVV